MNPRATLTILALLIVQASRAAGVWEPIPQTSLNRLARDTMRAHAIDSVIRVSSIAAAVTRQNAYAGFAEEIGLVQGDSIDLGKGLIKRVKK